MRKRLVDSYTDPATNITFGLRGSPVDFSLAQKYTNEHVSAATRDFLTKAAAGPVVEGFDYTLAGQLKLSVAAGRAYDPAGVFYETITDPPGGAALVTLDAADPALARIDLVYAVLESGVQAVPLTRMFRRVASEAELTANGGRNPYLPQPIERFAEEHARARVLVRKGVAAANPVAPAANAGEAPLFQVRVNAGAAVLVAGNVTDVRTRVKSLASVATDLAAHVAAADPHAQYLTQGRGDARYSQLGHTHAAATAAAAGFMPAADKEKLDAATALATPNALVRRDAGGAFAAGGVSLLANQGGARPTLLTLTNSGIGSRTGSQIDFNSGSAVPGARITQDFNTSGANDCSLMFSLAQVPGAGLADVLQLGFAEPRARVFGSLSVSGSLSKGSGTYLIDHPLTPNTKDLIHGFVESNEYLLVYRVSATLAGGVASVNLDTELGLTQETLSLAAAELKVYSVYSEGPARVAAEIQAAAGAVGQVLTLVLTSADVADTSDVNVLLLGRRKDPYIFTDPWVDATGRLVPEQNKLPPAAQDLNALALAYVTVEEGDPRAGTGAQRDVVGLIGRVGFPRYPHVVPGGGAKPVGPVIFVEPGMLANGPLAPFYATSMAGTGLEPWDASEEWEPGLEAEASIGAGNGSSASSEALRLTRPQPAVPDGYEIVSVIVQFRRRQTAGSAASSVNADVSLVVGDAIVPTTTKSIGQWTRLYEWTSVTFSGADLAGLDPADAGAAGFGFAVALNFQDPNQEEDVVARITDPSVTIVLRPSVWPSAR